MPAQRNDTGSQPVQRVPFGRVSAARPWRLKIEDVLAYKQKRDSERDES